MDTELYAERASGETAEAVGEYPEGDECTDEENDCRPFLESKESKARSGVVFGVVGEGRPATN